MAPPSSSMRSLVRPALLFLAFGAVLYLAVSYAAERLLYRTGDSNPFFKIVTSAAPEVDWVILGASHAMPLDFADFNGEMERDTGLRIINLASPGTGPLYNRYVLDGFLGRQRTAQILYVIDSFGFYSQVWNEDRFGDAKLLRRTPFDLGLASLLAHYVRDEGVSATAVLDYLTGFSKLNNPQRFEPDVWEGEATFERTFRPSATADQSRIEYLYPDTQRDPGVFRRYLLAFSGLLDRAEERGASVVVIKMPVPARFKALLPDESDFDERLAEILEARSIPFLDFSSAMNEARFYSDTDHLNRAGVTEFFTRHLRAVLVSENDGQPSP